MIDAPSRCLTDAQTLLDVLDFQVEAHPFRCAYVFCRDDGERTELTYLELARRAKAIAAELQEKLKRGDRALLVFPPGLEFLPAFFGCLYAGVLAVPATYPKPRRPMPRLAMMASDCQPAAVLTTAQTLAALEVARTAPELANLPWIAADEIADGAEAAWRRPDLSRDSLAFLQYTSGSTSDPKGVMVSHGNLLHNLEVIRHGFGVGEVEVTDSSACGVFWLPAYHDMGLIGGILEPLYIGGPSVLMSPASFLQRPHRWLQAISEFHGAVSGAPNFAYELCVNKITPEQRAELDLSCWCIAFCGAEPIRPTTLERFAETFAPCGFRPDAFYPCYGLAESTLLASGGRGPGRPKVKTVSRAALARHQVAECDGDISDAQELVSCGQALLDQEIVIVDCETGASCPENRVGEIWIGGPSVTRGYWNHDEENAATFGGKLDERSDARFLRTGDLGFISDGQLFVTGRIKDVIIIRGRNHYPQDIERSVEDAHPALRCAGGAVFAIDGESGEQVVVVHEIDRQHRDADYDEIFRAVRREVAREHDVEVHAVVLIRQTDLARTTSGKVQRSLCRQRYLEDDLKVVAQWRTGDRRESIDEPPLATNANGHHADPASCLLPSASCAPAAPSPLPPASPLPPLARPTTPLARPTTPLAPEEIDRLAERIETWLLDWLMRRAEVPQGELDRDKPLADYGIDSLAAVELSQELEKWLGVELTPILAWNHPTAALLARYLAGEAARAACGEPTMPEEPPGAPAENEDEFARLLAEIENLSDDEAEEALGERPA
jgi:acyl-CoA synthetase (AMP-forming)/AMP-acid ligase II/acyl carrier protein